MKIQCDVCNKNEASVFCSADEAALCAACDLRVHHANKLAGKHDRFSLLLPSPKQLPLCDICQNKSAFLFCQQDRAILCRDCDVRIHQANEHTQNHNRFLLTGVKLSTLTNGGIDSVSNLKPQNPNKKPNPVHEPAISDSLTVVATAADNGGSTSSISEYLIEMLPGWRVDDFLDSTLPSSGSSKQTVDDVIPIWDVDLETNLSSFSSPKNMGIWVPQAPPTLFPSQYPSSSIAFGGQIGFKEAKEATNYTKLSSRKWRDDGGFTVPQISPPSVTHANKRCRNNLW
ncbi:B-box zinc finger protein [Actinidia chinensis var. chinensis]|uniref:B-box zinc finger protein n=1 Tax=Actinidia chinensis var. chinensis TaxID=1590841 RepID=A0A2R6R061_ACTCC|nr:B-box zinc finger protein [Actinidia chinensis var. chinensis]